MYECPVTNDVVARSVPSDDTRVRLGMPGSAQVLVVSQPASSWSASNVVTMPRRVRRQVAAPEVAYTRSHATWVNARGPPGSARLTIDTRPYLLPTSVLRNTTRGPRSSS